MFTKKIIIPLAEGLSIEVFEHNETKAMHYHYTTADKENAFLVAFKTAPTCSNGVAHVLEHTVLCGSKNFPLRDPFFAISRQSVNVFQNAMTGSDITYYPIASASPKDVENLVSIYLDAVFFPNLNEFEFMQEGNRIDLKDAEDPDAGFEFKGVVFNEMKGAMAPAARRHYQTICENLAAGSHYAVNSGGEPLDVLDLTHEDLLEFHKKHYHPSNAVFVTYGDLGAAYYQNLFEEKALSEFEYSADVASVTMGERNVFDAPKKVVSSYAYEGKNSETSAVASVSWLFEDVKTLEDYLTLDVLITLLKESDSAPVPLLIKSNPNKFGTYGGSYSLGYMTAPTFMVCVADFEEGKEAEFEAELLSCIDTFSKEVTEADIRGAIKSLKRSSLYVEGSGHIGTTGLGLAYSLLDHLGDGHKVDSFGKNSEILDALAVSLTKEGVVGDLLQKLFIANNQRLLTLVKADHSFEKQNVLKEELKLAEAFINFEEGDYSQLLEKNKLLKERQNKPEDFSCLPEFTTADVDDPTPFSYYANLISSAENLNVYLTKTLFSGIAKARIDVPLPELSKDELKILPLYMRIVTKLGAGEKTYVEMADAQAKFCESFYASRMVYNAQGTKEAYAYLTFEASFLIDDAEELSKVIADILQNVRFDELQRIESMLQSQSLAAKNSFNDDGRAPLLLATGADFTPLGELSNLFVGPKTKLELINNLDGTAEEVKSSIANYAYQFAELHKKIMGMVPEISFMGRAEDEASLLQSASVFAGNIEDVFIDKGYAELAYTCSGNTEDAAQLWKINGSMNYVVKSYKAVSVSDVDAAALSVLSTYLKNTFIHTEVREKGGAYGGGVQFNLSKETFNFMSFRDPNVINTLKAFAAAIDYVRDVEVDDELLEHAKLSVISGMNSSAANTPFKAANVMVVNALPGTVPEDVRLAHRHDVLKVTAEDLKEVCQKYLAEGSATYGIAATSSHLETESIEDIASYLGLPVTQYLML